MTPELKEKWIEALRSGDFPKGKSTLLNDQGQYCCLGVLCEIHDEVDKVEKFFGNFGKIKNLFFHKDHPDDWNTVFLPYSVREKVGISVPDMHKVAEINDISDDFSNAITYIEENL